MVKVLAGILLLGLAMLAAGMLWPPGAAAQVSIITPDGGQAAWFFGACVDEDATGIVRWDLRPDLAYPEGNALQLQVKNGYPGHRLSCKLYLANTGDIPLLVNNIQVDAVASGILVEAFLPPEEQGKILGPCMKQYTWLTPPENAPAYCRTAVQLSIQTRPDAFENSSYRFELGVHLTSADGG